MTARRSEPGAKRMRPSVCALATACNASEATTCHATHAADVADSLDGEGGDVGCERRPGTGCSAELLRHSRVRDLGGCLQENPEAAEEHVLAENVERCLSFDVMVGIWSIVVRHELGSLLCGRHEGFAAGPPLRMTSRPEGAAYIDGASMSSEA